MIYDIYEIIMNMKYNSDLKDKINFTIKNVYKFREITRYMLNMVKTTR